MRKLRTFFFATCFVLAVSGFAHAEPDAATQSIFKNLMTATIANDHRMFINECDGAMKDALSKSMLRGVSEQIAPRCKSGYKALYLGELKQLGYQVHLWRLSFKDGADDILATLSVKNGKAGGFYLR